MSPFARMAFALTLALLVPSPVLGMPGTRSPFPRTATCRRLRRPGGLSAISPRWSTSTATARHGSARARERLQLGGRHARGGAEHRPVALHRHPARHAGERQRDALCPAAGCVTTAIKKQLALLEDAHQPSSSAPKRSCTWSTSSATCTNRCIARRTTTAGELRPGRLLRHAHPPRHALAARRLDAQSPRRLGQLDPRPRDGPTWCRALRERPRPGVLRPAAAWQHGTPIDWRRRLTAWLTRSSTRSCRRRSWTRPATSRAATRITLRPLARLRRGAGPAVLRCRASGARRAAPAKAGARPAMLLNRVWL